MNDADFLALKDDIENNGQREPVIVLDGMVLDGWHRFQACTQLGMAVKKFTFDPSDDPVAFVLSQNMHRRHLTASQRAAAVVACSNWSPPHRQKKSAPGADLSKTTKELAIIAGTGTRTIEHAKAAEKAGLGDLVKEGVMTAKEGAKVASGKIDEKPSKVLPKPEVAFIEHDQDKVQILSEENDRLNDRLAVVAMDATPEERSAAKDTIASLRAELKTMGIELAAVKASRDSLMMETNELKKQCASQRKQIEKLTK
jgi:hypothetical protein